MRINRRFFMSVRYEGLADDYGRDGCQKRESWVSETNELRRLWKVAGSV